MREQDYQISSDFLKRLFGETLHKVELRAFPNINGDRGAEATFTRDASEIEGFCKKKDGPGFGVFFGVCTRGDVRTDKGLLSGGLDNLKECPALWVDIDCVKQGLTGKEVMEALSFLPFQPSIIINSGGGLHVYWALEAPVDISEGQPARDAVAAALKALVGVLAGDMKSTDLARVMRLPGTLNTKEELLARYGGKPSLCAVIEDTGRVHDLEALCEWLSEQRAVLHGQAQPARPVREDDPFVAYARQAGYEPAIDIDAELAAMEHGGSDRTAIHPTHLRVSASMIARGYEDDEIVDRILKATEAVAPRDKQWNWAAEERAIRKMIQTGRGKGYAEKRTSAQPMVSGNNVLKLVPDADVEKKAKPEKASKEAKDEISVLGGATLAAWTERYGPIMHAAGDSYLYEGGVWSAWGNIHDQMLRALLQEGCSRLRMKPATSLLNAASRYVMDRPELLARNVEFDQLDMIVAEDGCLEMVSLEIIEHSPDHRAKFRIGANLKGGRDCPAFLDFLKGSFSDHPAAETQAIIATLQEWFGAALVANKPRSLRKGLLIHGGSRTGKTQISEILRALLGKGHTTAIKVRDLEKDFGTETLLGKRGWIADDAVGQGETLDAETYKVLVTGEAMSVRRKNRSMIDGFRFACPVCLTMNNLPKIKDGSDAVYNRSIVLPMTHVRAEDAPEPAGYDSISAKVIAEELTGVLWWAIEGWQRLAARGVYTPPACMSEAIRGLQEMNDDVGTWIRQCVVADAGYKVAPSDLFASFAGWFFQEKGDTKFNWSQNGFSRKLKERLPHVGAEREARKRWTTGVRLNDDGLENWTINSERSEMKRASTPTLEVYGVNVVQDAPEAKSIGNTRF